MDIHVMVGCCFLTIFPSFICLDTLRTRAACFLTCPGPTAHAAPSLRVQNTPFTLPFLQGPGSACGPTQAILSGEEPAQDIGQEVRHDSCPISTPVGLWPRGARVKLRFLATTAHFNVSNHFTTAPTQELLVAK